jgi:hypothetical protein
MIAKYLKKQMTSLYMGVEKNEILEKAFKEVKCFLKTTDQRTRSAKDEYRLARQEFLAELEDLATKWFKEKVSSFHDKSKIKLS